MYAIMSPVCASRAGASATIASASSKLKTATSSATSQIGQRFKSLEQLAQAARLQPSLELRNEAIACMALVDLRPGPEWEGSVPGSTGVRFDAALERSRARDRLYGE